MKQLIKTLLVLTTLILSSSFTITENFVGKYSVSEYDPSQITLIINSDRTFFYQDLSISDKKIVVNGTWVLRKGKVFLKDNKSSSRFHNVWTFSDNGQVAKSRKGFTFYRLSKTS